MKLTVLGCWGGFSFQDAGTTSFLLQADDFSLLIDCGSQALTSLEHYLDPLELDAVILSHYHHDHIADLGVLQYYRQLYPTTTPKKVLPIYGHAEDAFHFGDLTLAGVSEGIAYDSSGELIVGPFAITFLKTVHPVICYALRIREVATGKILTFTGDSGYLETLNAFSENSDVLLADTYLFNGHEHHRAHLTAGEAGTLAKVSHSKKLVLTHLPQVGDLTLLQEQAQETAGPDILVCLAAKNLQINI